MNILISGVTGFRNRGVAALVTTIIQQVRRRLPDATLMIATRDPEYDALMLADQQVKILSDEFQMTALGRARRALAAASMVHPGLYPDYRQLRRQVCEADLVIVTGGDLFGSIYDMDQHLGLLRHAAAHGVPIAFLAQSVGPFDQPGHAEVWLKVARRADSISVRESISWNYLTRDLGLPQEKILLAADPAFLLEPPPAPQVAAMRRSLGLRDDRPTVALSVSQGIAYFMRCDPALHQVAWRRLLDWMLRDWDAQVLLIPHSQNPTVKGHDGFLATQLQRLASFPEGLYAATGNYTASEYKGLIASCDMVIAERMHAAIAGLSSGVCAVPISYSVKADGIAHDLFAGRLDQPVLLPYADLLKVEAAQQHLSAVWRNRRQVAAVLREQLPAVKEKAGQAFDFMLERFIRPTGAVKPA